MSEFEFTSNWVDQYGPIWNSILLHEPKIAIDAFTNIFREKLTPVADMPIRQVYYLKTA